MRRLSRWKRKRQTVSNTEYASDHGAAETDLDTVMEIGRTALISGDRSFLDNEVDSDAMCTLMFTSGTTGMAKGVMLSQRNIAANV
mgnify:CR=1 FL=1